MKYYAAVDVGGTEIKHGLLTEEGTVLEKGSQRTPLEKGGEGILQAVLGIVEQYSRRYPLSGVPVSSTGVVDCQTGSIVYAGPTVPNFIGTAFKKGVEERFTLPCEVENDVNCAGLAEYVSGAGQGSSNLICLTVGTGIGGCAILDGKVVHGAAGSAMEIGYLPLDGGEFQDLGSTSALCRRVAQRKGETLELWNGKRIFENAAAGDEICSQEIDAMCQILGQGIATLCYVLNPDTIVLGGGVMAQSEILKPKIERALKERLRPIAYESLSLRFATHGNDAGMIGALYHFLTRQGQSMVGK